MKHLMSVGEFAYEFKKRVLQILLWRAIPIYVLSAAALYWFYVVSAGMPDLSVEESWQIYIKVQTGIVLIGLMYLHITIPRPFSYFLRVFPFVAKTIRRRALEDLKENDKWGTWSLETREVKVEGRANKELNRILRKPGLGLAYLEKCQTDGFLYNFDAYSDILSEERRAKEEDRVEEERPRKKARREPAMASDTEVVSLPSSSAFSKLFNAPVVDEEEVEAEVAKGKKAQASDINERYMKVAMPVLILIGALGLYQLVQIVFPAFLGTFVLMLPFLITAAFLAWLWKSMGPTTRTVVTIGAVMLSIFIVGQLLPAQTTDGAQASTGGNGWLQSSLGNIMNLFKGDEPEEVTPTPEIPTPMPTEIPLVQMTGANDINLVSQIITADTENKGKGEVMSAANVVLDHRLVLEAAMQKIQRENMDIIEWDVLEIGNGTDSGFRQGLWLLEDWINRGLASSGMQEPLKKRVYTMSANGELDPVLAGQIVNISDGIYRTDEAIHSMVTNFVCVQQAVKAAGMNLDKADSAAIERCWLQAESAEALANSRIVDLNRALAEVGISTRVDMFTGYVAFMKEALPPNKEVEVKVTATPEGQSNSESNDPEPTLRAAAPDSPTATPDPSAQFTPTAPAYTAPNGCPADPNSIAGLNYLGEVESLWDVLAFITEEPATIIEVGACNAVKMTGANTGWITTKSLYTDAKAGDRVRVVVEGNSYQLWLVDGDGNNSTLVAEAGQN